MFEEFYGLSRTPFTRDFPTDQLYVSITLEETLSRLEYAAQRQLFAVVTGDCGTGNDIFSDGAVDEIYRFSSGAARLVNKVCIHCLIYGAQNGRRIIDDHMVKLVVQGELS
jgi:type II secretory pathway predicted ATPase ExeA